MSKYKILIEICAWNLKKHKQNFGINQMGKTLKKNVTYYAFDRFCRCLNTQKTVSLNQRNIFLIYGQKKISFGWRKFCRFKKMFFNVNNYISLNQRTFFWINKTFFDRIFKKCFFNSKKLFSQWTLKFENYYYSEPVKFHWIPQ